MIRNISYHNAGKYICVAKQPSIEDGTREKAVVLQVFREYRLELLEHPILSLKANISFDRPKFEFLFSSNLLHIMSPPEYDKISIMTIIS